MHPYIFEENWVGYKRGNRRKAPRFAIASWNTYGRLRAEKPRTTNELEGWHSGIRKLVGKDHPPFYESVENMWKMEALATKTQVDRIPRCPCLQKAKVHRFNC